MQNVDLCIVLPVHNEKDCLIAVVDELCTTLSTIPTLKQVALLIVDDFSQDGGIELLKQWFKEQQLDSIHLAIVRLKHQHGVGGAYLKGFRLAVTWQPTLTLVIDADGQHDPSCVAELIELAASVDIVCTLRGKRGDGLFLRFCHAFFYKFLQFMTKKNLNTSNFCMMQLPVLEYLAKASHIDYLGAFLDAAPFSCHKLIVERRRRIAGSSKFGFFGHVHTAAVVMSYHPQLLARLRRLSYVLMLVLAVMAVITTNFAAIAVLALFVILTQLWNGLLSEILAKRSMPSHSAAEDTVEQVFTHKNLAAG